MCYRPCPRGGHLMLSVPKPPPHRRPSEPLHRMHHIPFIPLRPHHVAAPAQTTLQCRSLHPRVTHSDNIVAMPVGCLPSVARPSYLVVMINMSIKYIPPAQIYAFEVGYQARALKFIENRRFCDAHGCNTGLYTHSLWSRGSRRRGPVLRGSARRSRPRSRRRSRRQARGRARAA